MDKPNSNFFSIGKILAMLFFCSLISLFIYAVSIFYVFGIGNCPPGGCRTTAWENFAAYMVLLLPFFVFIFGAYLCRTDIRALTTIKFLRVILFAAFALFPLYLAAGLMIYAVNS